MELIATEYGRISSSASKAWSVTVNGEKYSGKTTVGIANNATKTLASGSTTIKHNADGSKTFSYSFSQDFSGITFSGSALGNVSGSGSGTLDIIPRTSSVSATAANIGAQTTITISRASSSFTHTLTYAFGSLTGTIATKTTSTSVKWTVPTSFYAQIPNAKYGTCTITCETFSGSTSIGKDTVTFRATAAEANCKPTLNPSVSINTDTVTYKLTGSTTKFIKYYTWISYATGAAAKNSASIKSQKVTNGSHSSTEASGTLAGAITDSKVSFSVTDSRGYSNTKDLTVDLVNYVKLTCNLTANAPTPQGEMSFTVKGNYYNGSFGAVANTLTVQYRYKVNDGSYGAWTTMTATKSGNSYTATAKLTGLDYKNSYTIQARAADALFNGTYEPIVVSAAKKVKTTPVFDWGEDDFNFNVPVMFSAGANCPNKVLWSGGFYMNGEQTINLSDNISNQLSGIVLVFSRYDVEGGAVMNEHFCYEFVPKQIVALQEGKGSIFNLSTSNGTYTASKYLYISDSSIKGHANNTAIGTGNNGVKYNNNRFVLRYVIGV